MSSRKPRNQTLFKIGIMMAVCAALILLPTDSFQPASAQEGLRSRSPEGDLECVSYCSPIRPGTVLMEVALRLADRTMSESALLAKVRQQGLDVTVYADGFERGLFATVSAVRPRALFRRTTSAKRIPGLEKLVITDVATRLDKSAQSFRLTHPPLGSTEVSEWVTVRLEGLDPGLVYTYRVPGRSSVVMCPAVSCPVDRVPAPINRRNRRP